MLIATRTVNFATVTRTNPGMYCLELSPSSGICSGTTSAAVSVDFTGTAAPQGNTTVVLNSGCGTNGISVRTYRRASGSATDSALADNVAFTIVVP